MSRNKPDPIYNAAGKEICGAQTRDGGQCQQSPMANGRCRHHGGSNPGAPKGNQNARTHGVWSRLITPEEEEFLALPDDERMSRLQALAELRAFRAHDAERDIDDDNKLKILQAAFAQNGRLAASLAQVRIRMDKAEVVEKDKDEAYEGKTSVQRIGGIVGIFDRARERRASETAGPSSVESDQPATDRSPD